MNILELTQACFNKVESEVYPDKYLNSTPNKDMVRILTSNQFESLYGFTLFLVVEYQSDLKLNEIFILNRVGTYFGLFSYKNWFNWPYFF